MDEIEEFVDERQQSWCIHCGEWIADLETSRDHAPSKCLLLKPYPTNLPVMQICRACNLGFSHDEEYLVAFLGTVLTGSTAPDRQTNPAARRILARNQKLRARIDHTRTDYKTVDGATRYVWVPEIDRVNRIVLKNARGHVYFEYGEPMLSQPKYVWAMPLEFLSIKQREDFQNVNFGRGWPEVGSRMMTRVCTGQDLADGWVVAQDKVYRYAVSQTRGTLVRSLLFDYLGTEVFWED